MKARRLQSRCGGLSSLNFHLSTKSRHRHDFTIPTIDETLRADIILAMKARDSGTALAQRTADAAIQRAAMDRRISMKAVAQAVISPDAVPDQK